MNRKGNVVLSPDSELRGFRDGYSGHRPRSKADSYRRGYEDGHTCRMFTGEWMTRARFVNNRGLRPSAEIKAKFFVVGRHEGPAD
jgi:hypothetical protein